MSRPPDALFDSTLAGLLDELSRGANADGVVAAALARTVRTRQRPAWLVSGRATSWMADPMASPVPRLLLVGLLLLIAVLVVIVAAGSQRRLPPPFGLARSGAIAYEADGHVWLAAADGAAPRKLTSGPFPEMAPVWSRDGTKLAFRRLTANEPSTDPGRFADLVVANADGSAELTIAASVPFMSNPTWSPDSRWLAFTRSVDVGPDHLIVAAADGSRLLDLGDLGSGAWGPSWAPDGMHIAVAVGNRVVVVNRDGGGFRPLSQRDYVEVGSQSIVGDWSPAGDAFVFAAGDVGLKRVYLVGVDGRPERPIGLPDTNQEDPSWSPDGSRIAYLRAGIGLGPVVVIAGASGQDTRVLPGYYAWCTPVWSPDGSRIIVLDDRPGDQNLPGPSVVLALDPDGLKAPITLDAPQGPLANDNAAGSWQRLAP